MTPASGSATMPRIQSIAALAALPSTAATLTVPSCDRQERDLTAFGGRAGGEVVGVVNNFRFNESPLDLLRRCTQAGVSERTLPREWGDWVTRTAMPSLRIPDFHMSSVSQAS